MNKIGLETFAQDMDNSFAYSIDKLIRDLKEENLKSWNEHDNPTFVSVKK